MHFINYNYRKSGKSTMASRWRRLDKNVLGTCSSPLLTRSFSLFDGYVDKIPLDELACFTPWPTKTFITNEYYPLCSGEKGFNPFFGVMNEVDPIL